MNNEELFPPTDVDIMIKPKRRGFIKMMIGAAGALLAGGKMMSDTGIASAEELPVQNNGAKPESDSEVVNKQVAPGVDKQNLIETITAKNDLIPREKLWQDYRIKILDSPDVTFDFRETALDKEHLFKAQKERTGAVKIILVDGHFIHPKFLTEEQKKELTPQELAALERDIEKAKNMVRSHFTSERTVKQKNVEFSAKKQELDAQLEKGDFSPDKHNVELQILEEEYRPYLKGPSEEDLLQDLTGMAPPLNDRNPNDPEATRLIFLPVKDPQPKLYKSGDYEAKVDPDPYFLRAPRPENSFTDPDDLDVDFKGEMYPIRNPNLDSVSRHEIKHAAGMGHPSADFEPYNELVIAKREARKGNYDWYWAVWRSKEHGTMIGNKEPDKIAA